MAAGKDFMSRFDEIEKIVSRANRDLKTCRLATKDILWPLLRNVVDGNASFAWRGGLRNTKGVEGEYPRPKQIVAIGLVAKTTDGRFTIGAALGVKREPTRSHCGRRGILDREEVLVDPSLAWKEIGPWELVEGKPWDLPKPSGSLLKRIATWAENTGYDRVTLTRAEAEAIIKEHSPPRIYAWRFVLAPGWTLKKARAEAKTKSDALNDALVLLGKLERDPAVSDDVLEQAKAKVKAGVAATRDDHVTLHADNRWQPCLTMTIPWTLSDYGFNGKWEHEDEPFEGNLEWECPEFIEAVEVLTDPVTGATVLMKPKRRGAELGPDEPEEPPERPDYGNKSDWTARRTCSRVSSGVCVNCESDAFHSAWVSGDRVLCGGCYTKHFEPEKAAAEKVARKAADEKRKSDLALALKGQLPGATVTANGTVFGPPCHIMGVPAREILREGLYDTAPFVPSKDSKPFFQAPKDDVK